MACFSKITNLNNYPRRTPVLISFVIILALIFASFIITSPALGSELDDFETTATTDNSQQTTDEQEEEEQDDDLFDQFWNDLFGDIFNGMLRLVFEGAQMSLARTGEATDIDPTLIDIRQTGEPTLPYFQMDYRYIRINSDISALDRHLELGDGPLGFEYRNTYFTEINPNDNLTLSQYHLLLRISATRSQEFGVGIGAINLSGNAEHSGFSLAFPIKIYPNDSLGIKIKPTYNWINGNFIGDHDLALTLTRQFGSLELGYRFLEANGKDLNGSYIGLAFHY